MVESSCVASAYFASRANVSGSEGFARVVISGSGDLYGSVVGATVSATAGAKFHYDKRLKDNQDGGIVMVTWREVF